MAKLLVIGFGSIGARHARCAVDLGHEVAVVSRRSLPDVRSYPSIEAALAAEPDFDAAVIATETSRHADNLRELGQHHFGGRVLVEKPLFSDQEQARDSTRDIRTDQVSVAYNLRQHPVLQMLKAELADQRVLNAVVHVGQDLRQWRDRDPGDSYSSSKALGGGVLRDLSHELDYLLWLFGPWSSVSATGGKRGSLPGDADDHWGILIRFTSGSLAVLAMDYFCARAVRTITVNTDSGTSQADLIAGSFQTEAGVRSAPVDRDSTYHRQLAALLAGGAGLPTYAEGLEVLRLIEAVERSGETGRMVVS